MHAEAMAHAQAQAQERRAQSPDLAGKLLAERNEMLVSYCRLAGVDPTEHSKPNGKLLQSFCQVLLDYISAGHFVLYERISDGKERRAGIVALASKLYPRIARTTEMAVEFNDKYDGAETRDLNAEFHNDLSQLGEELAVRADLEDRLLAGLAR